MKVQNITNYNYNYNYNKTTKRNPSFNGWRTEIYRSDAGNKAISNIKYCTTTCMFRRYPSWKELTSLIAEKYKSVPKVNVYDYACSDGCEAYTFLIAMFNDNGYNFTKKFTPIIAKDINGAAMYRAESGKTTLCAEEISVVDNYTNGQFKNYFYSPYSDDMYRIQKWEVMPILKDNVKFSHGDVLKDYKEIIPENSIVFVRNVWPYFAEEERAALAKGLFSQLKDNCLLIIGDYDINNEKDVNMAEKLIDAGFKPSKVDYVYEK